MRGAAATLLPDEPFEAFAALGSLVRDRSEARVVGITGSTGKTSTKDILAALCAPAARTVAAEASFNNEIGVPLTLCRLEPDTEVCILELAMRGFGQIADLCRIARPHVGVITNVGPVHLELVGSLEGVQRAKGELVAALPPGGTAVVPEELPGRARRHRGRPAGPAGGAARGRPHDRRRRQLQLHGRAPGRERRRRAGRARRARAAAARARRRRVLALARRGAAAAGRRPADQRRLQREPGLDARGARAPRRDRGRAADGSRSSATWRSSARARRPTTRRSGSEAARHGVDVLLAVGELGTRLPRPRRSRAALGRRTPRARPPRPPSSSGRATSCSSRPRARWAWSGSPKHSRR